MRLNPTTGLREVTPGMSGATRRQFICSTVAAGSAAALAATQRAEAKDNGKSPNPVFVLCDQMRGQAASNYRVCSPYRGMLMTGQSPMTGSRAPSSPN